MHATVSIKSIEYMSVYVDLATSVQEFELRSLSAAALNSDIPKNDLEVPGFSANHSLHSPSRSSNAGEYRQGFSKMRKQHVRITTGNKVCKNQNAGSGRYRLIY